ncbi:hypothetical protein Scep_024278 [Stephania cephalantha]|uniref:RNase H type-1 domain-containing protein n=1 Tax=Stephania cephalantha TaxID=152367 RepID=A0AAP0F1Q8_9MAGN
MNGTPRSSERRPEKWKPPQANYLKMNVDASVRAGTKGCGISGVFRDKSGSIHVAFIEYIDDPFSIDLAEIWAMKRGIEIAQELDLHISEVESDA